MTYELSLITLKACLLAGLFPYLLYLAKYRNSEYVAIVLTAVFLSVALALKSRTAFFAISIIYVCTAQRQWLQKVRVKKFLLLLIPVLVFFFLINFHSTLGRLFIWFIILANMQDIGWFGVGWNNFRIHYADWQSHYFQWHQQWSKFHWIANSPSYAFNEWLHFGVEFGIMALLLLTFILALNIY